MSCFVFQSWKEYMREGYNEPYWDRKWDWNREAYLIEYSKVHTWAGGCFGGGTHFSTAEWFLALHCHANFRLRWWNVWIGSSIFFFLCTVSALFPRALSVPAHSITALCSQKNEILTASPPKSCANICNWIKQLPSLPISHFQIAFPRVLLMHIRLKDKSPFLPTHNELLIYSKNPWHGVHTYTCTRLLVVHGVFTIASF